MSDIAVSELDELVSHEGALIVDVRESEEYAVSHIPGALSVPAGTLEHAADETSVARNDELLGARTSAIVVYCDDGRRSRHAAVQLRRLGFDKVYVLAGGLPSWDQAGYPLARP